MREPQPRRWTRDEYHRMAEAGILGEDDRVELLDGEIVEMTPIGRLHSGCVGWLTCALSEKLSRRAVVWVQNPVQLGEHSEPQPDVALLRPRPDFYRRGHPGPEDVLLVVEVADTTARFDRAVKLPLYARAGMPEVWLVDLSRRHVERHSDPAAGLYRKVERIGAGGNLALPGLADVTLAVDDILG